MLPDINRIEIRGCIEGKTGKTAVLPGFCKIEHGGGGAPACYRGLFWLGRVRRASGAPGNLFMLSIVLNLIFSPGARALV